MNGIEFDVQVDSSAMRDALADLERLSGRFASAFSSSLRSAIADGREFEDVLRGLALRLSSLALDAAVAPLEQGASNVLSNIVGGLTGALTGAVAPPASVPVPTMRSDLGQRAAQNVTLNVSTPDAASFRRSEGQIAAMLARTAIRGRRSL